jgi:hypothetical protein
MVICFFLLIGYFESLKYGGCGWLLLVLSIALVVLYLILGFYWIFQKVEINHVGLKQTIFNITIKEVPWESVEEIVCTTVMRNPAYVIKYNDSEKLVLDKRKKIMDAIRHYTNGRISNLP